MLAYIVLVVVGVLVILLRKSRILLHRLSRHFVYCDMVFFVCEVYARIVAFAEIINQSKP